MIIKNCLYCKKQFMAKNTIWHIRNGRGVYCSIKCSGDRMLVEKIKRNCLICNKVFEFIPSRVNKAKYCSKKCSMIKTSIIELVGDKGFWLDKKRPELKNTNSAKTMFKRGQTVGDKNAKWKGGISKLHKTARNLFMQTTDYKEWRIAVFTRDNYTCQFCGKRGVVLHADHIKSYALFPKLRLDINNGRTLCVECHKTTPTYGGNTIVAKEVMFYA